MEINKPITSFILFAICAVLIFLFVYPKFQQSAMLKDTLAQRQAEYANDVVYYKNVEDVIKIIDSKKEDLAKIDNALPTDLSFGQLLYFLQKKGAEAGVVVKSVNFNQGGSTDISSEARSINFTLSGSGGYQPFKKFLASLDSSVRLFEVDSISLKPSGFSQAAGLTSAEQQLYTFDLIVETRTY